MNRIHAAFWNIENLFDVEPSIIGANLEFTPARGWTEAAKNKKIENLSQVVNSMHDHQGPDLFGLCEIENEQLAKELITAMGKQDVYSIAGYNDGPDIRGIDTCLIYSKNILKLNYTKSYNINLRYPTRDIFVANFTVMENDSEITVLVNHWPSRTAGRYETEPLRVATAENCARAIEDVLKIPMDDLQQMPNNIRTDPLSLSRLDRYWNKNVLLMGDFNDSPYDKSVLHYLKATPDRNKLMNWKEIFEHPSLKRWPSNQQTDKHNYLFYQSFLYNCMWQLIPDGTIFYDGGLDLFDQFIVSRGLLHGEQGLQMNMAEVKINKSTKMINHIPEHKFDPLDKTKVYPIYKESPMRFEYRKIKPNGELEDLFPGREDLTGFSDHFPIESVIEIT
ncbi:MAG: hypothetical protein M3162_07785 [Thermoproteota archaeon]|nr:hypothetical protein [Thermoproteota archaeon]